MRVITKPGTYLEEERELSVVMAEYFTQGHQNLPILIGELINILVARRILTLADCQWLGGPYMEEAKDE